MKNEYLKSKMFFTSDWHLNHAKSIEFDERPFDDIEHMHEVLINNYNASVGPNDVCYFLGDLGIGTPQDLAKVIQRLNGNKILVLGNHDKPGLARYIAMGFNAVQYGATVMIANELVTMTHCPLLDTFREDTSRFKSKFENDPWHGNSNPKHRNCSTKNYGQFHLHGHIHSRPNRSKSKKILNRQFDVGVPANKYRPVSQSEIESWIVRTKISEKI